MSSKRTLWPFGILLIIVLGIILITVSIKISMQQSIDTDHTFDRTRLNVNENINDIMAHQNNFDQIYKVHIAINQEANEKSITMNAPYYITPVPKIEGGMQKSDMLRGENDEIYLFFEEQNGVVNDFEIKDIALEFVRLVQGDKDVSVLSVPVKKVADNAYKTDLFSLPLKGYYQARFAIKTQSLSTQDNFEYPAYFYHWIFNNAK